jgi:hypothetical protein
MELYPLCAVACTSLSKQAFILQEEVIIDRRKWRNGVKNKNEFVRVSQYQKWYLYIFSNRSYMSRNAFLSSYGQSSFSYLNCAWHVSAVLKPQVLFSA